jgi:lipid-A-disaccharide synthase-like uncharacterized protein
MNRRIASLASAGALLVLLVVVAVRGYSLASSPVEGGVAVKVQLRGAQDRAAVVRDERGGHVYILTQSDGTQQRFTPDQLAAQLYEQGDGGFWNLVNVSGPVGLLWVSIGVLGQILFTGRLLVQWIASEREHRSIVPPIFWWMSLVGSLMLLVYFFWRWDVVGILGQAFGYMVYIRNLVLIYGERRAPASNLTHVAQTPPLQPATGG